MKKLFKITQALTCMLIFLFFYQCSSPKDAIVFQEETEFKVNKAYFQEWYAGVDVGGTGVNIFVPVLNKPQHILIDSVFFRNLKGKLIERGGRYSALLKNKSKIYNFNPSNNPSQYPFTIKDNECVISYIENGETKYYKVEHPKEFAGTYYENGAPSIYVRERSAGLATLDEENDN